MEHIITQHIIIYLLKKNNKYDTIDANGSDILPQILVRYGDLILKGKNQKTFIKQVKQILLEKCQNLPIEYVFQHDRLYLQYLDEDLTNTIYQRLSYVSGIHSYSQVYQCEKDLQVIAMKAITILSSMNLPTPTTFKVESKRSDKSFALTSQQISKELSKIILRSTPFLKVEMTQPSLTLEVEIRQEAAYFYIGKQKGMGGFPVGISGKGLVLLSGGIDSPVAAYQVMKKGLAIECIHFESTPLTAIESVQKVVDLTARLARYAPDSTIKLHLVPFEALHAQILKQIPESYIVTIMRRMMLRIAQGIQERQRCLAIVTGDSLGQVASQTIDSLSTISLATNSLILRPLITYDKEEIIAISRQIDTFSISIRPFEDCCTIYMPKNPAIRPLPWVIEKIETKFDSTQLIDQAILETKTILVHADQELHLASKGFTVKEALHETS